MAKKRATEQQINNIIVVNKDKTYGIQLEEARLNVTTYTRKLYTEDTQVPMMFDKTVGYKFYAKGEYGPWVETSRPYKANLDVAIQWVIELMIQDGLEVDQDITKLPALINSIKKDLTSVAKAYRV